jgi:hypothetical protein
MKVDLIIPSVGVMSGTKDPFNILRSQRPVIERLASLPLVDTIFFVHPYGERRDRRIESIFKAKNITPVSFIDVDKDNPIEDIDDYINRFWEYINGLTEDPFADNLNVIIYNESIKDFKEAMADFNFIDKLYLAPFRSDTGLNKHIFSFIRAFIDKASNISIEKKKVDL